MSRHAVILQKSSEQPELFNRQPPAVDRHDPRNGASDYGRLIAVLLGGAEPLKVVAFISPSPGEGVTFAVTRVAAEIERRTDRRAAVLSVPELQSRPELQPAWLLRPSTQRRRGSEHVATLQTECDLLLVDAGSLAEGSILGVTGMLDGVVIVVEAGRTTKASLQRAIATINAAQCRLVGLVLNKYKSVLPAALERLLG